MKKCPTEKQKKRQLLIAMLITLAAIMDGIVLVINFNPTVVLCEIVLASCAVLQWSIYYNIQTRIDIETLLSNQQQGNEMA